MRTLKLLISMIWGFLSVSLSPKTTIQLWRHPDAPKNPRKIPNHVQTYYFSKLEIRKISKLWTCVYSTPWNVIIYVSFVTLWKLGMFKLWKSETLTSDTLILWNPETLELWIFETLKLWNFQVLKLQNFETLKPIVLFSSKGIIPNRIGLEISLSNRRFSMTRAMGGAARLS